MAGGQERQERGDGLNVQTPSGAPVRLQCCPGGYSLAFTHISGYPTACAHSPVASLPNFTAACQLGKQRQQSGAGTARGWTAGS
jgi:hypothetical protein